MADGYQIYRPSNMGSGRFRMTPQSRRFVIDNVPPEALPSELAAFLNIPLETTDTKLEMAMDMRTGMCKGVAFVTLPHSKSNNLMWSNGRSFLGHRLSIQLDDPFPFEKQKSDDTGFGGGSSRQTRSSSNRMGGMGDSSSAFGFDMKAADSMIPGLGKFMMDFMGSQQQRPQTNGGGPMRRGGFGGGRGQFGGRGGGARGGRGGRGGRGAPWGNRPQSQTIGGKRRNAGAKPEAKYHLVDIGAILTHGKFAGDEDSVIERAKEAGVQKIVIPSMHVEGSKHAQRMCKFFKGYLYFCAGVHPHNAAKNWKSDTLEQLEEIASDPQCVAIGECGLDFNRNFSDKRAQIEVFEKQVQLACKLQKPMLLHERDAFREMNEVLNKYQAMLPPVVIHCFTGNRLEAIKYIGMGYYIGITGYIWKDQDDGIKSLLRDDDLPLDKLLIETDAPFMFPFVDKAKFDDDIMEAMSEDAKEFARGCRRGRNEPATMPLVCELVAAFMSKSPEEVAHQTTINAHKFFRIPMSDTDKSSLGAMRDGPSMKKQRRGRAMDWTITDEIGFD